MRHGACSRFSSSHHPGGSTHATATATNRFIIGVLSLGLLAGSALMANLAQAVDGSAPTMRTRRGTRVSGRDAVRGADELGQRGRYWIKRPGWSGSVRRQHHVHGLRRGRLHRPTTGGRKGWRLRPSRADQPDGSLRGSPARSSSRAIPLRPARPASSRPSIGRRRRAQSSRPSCGTCISTTGGVGNTIRPPPLPRLVCARGHECRSVLRRGGLDSGGHSSLHHQEVPACSSNDDAAE